MYLTVNALSVPVMGVAVRAQCIGAGQVPTVYFARAEESGKNGTKIGPPSLQLYSVRVEIYSCKVRLVGGTSNKSANIGYVPIKT